MANNPPSERAENQPVISASKPVSVSVEPVPGGAMYHPLHVSRTVKTYPIQEHELLALDDLGRNSTLWTAIGSASLALFAGCIWDMIQMQPPAAASTGAQGFALLLLGVSVVAFWMGRSYGKKRESRLEKIMKECND
jgi:hypothetical protein